MILVATGLKQELNILEGAGVLVVAGGGDGGRLERELEDAAGDAEAVISMGLCGALAPDLKPGDWVVASEVFFSPLIPGNERNLYRTDAAWSAVLVRALRAKSGSVLGSDAMIASAAAKADAHAATAALAVDMESHIAAAVARRHNLPFAVARVVSDAADRSLPRAAQAGMAADGSMDIGAVLRALAADPRQLPALICVGAEAGKAFRELRRGRDFLGPGLGRSDVGELPLNVA
jgi:adenosylhomocysteine nucleosidase